MSEEEFRIAVIEILEHLSNACSEVASAVGPLTDTDFYVAGSSELNVINQKIAVLRQKLSS